MNKLLLDTYSTTDRDIIALTAYGIKSAPIIGKYHYNSARGRLDDHAHKDMIEICYCHKGQQVYEVDNTNYRVKGGDVFVTFPDELHGTGAYPEEKGVLYWLLIHVPADKPFFNCDETDGKAFIKALTNLPERHFKALPDMRKTLDDIMEAARNGGALQKVTIENLIVSFLLQVVAAANGQVRAEKTLTDNAAKINVFINTNYKENLSIEAMARMLNLSESRFKSWFKNEFGVPPVEFILRKRIDEAKSLMQHQPALSMSEIAYNLGFSSPQHFATIFKRYTTLSPKDFKSTVAAY